MKTKRSSLLFCEPNLLGPRKLLYCHKAGLQWNPKDEDCVAAEVLLIRDVSVDITRFSGELFEVGPLVTYT